MCDCYYKRCEVCKKGFIPVHIADFCIPRDDVRIYCKRHIPRKDGVIHIAEIKWILRGADEIIMRCGRSMLAKILKGSKDKKVQKKIRYVIRELENKRDDYSKGFIEFKQERAC